MTRTKLNMFKGFMAACYLVDLVKEHERLRALNPEDVPLLAAIALLLMVGMLYALFAEPKP